MCGNWLSSTCKTNFVNQVAEQNKEDQESDAWEAETEVGKILSTCFVVIFFAEMRVG